MNPKSNRVVITERGQSLVSQLLQESQIENSSPMMTARSCDNISISLKALSPLPGSATSRAGYFRPQKVTHLVLKNENSTRLYPNYLRQDPREYPTNHECVWEPKPTITSRKKIPPAFSVVKNIHHTLYSPHRHHNSLSNPTIKETNLLLGGETGYLVKELTTTCKYPDYKPVALLDNSISNGMRDSMYKTREGTPDKKLISAFSTPRKISHKQPPKSIGSFKLNLGEVFSPPDVDAKTPMHKTTLNWLSTTRFTGSMNTRDLSYRTFRNTLKMSEEKAEQLLEQFEENQKAYNEILSKLNEKVKKKHEKEQEIPDYFSTFDKKLRDGGKFAEELLRQKQKEEKRFMRRLKEAEETKYAKAWNEWDPILKKGTKSQEPVSRKAKERPMSMDLTNFDNESKISVPVKKENITTLNDIPGRPASKLVGSRLNLNKVTEVTTSNWNSKILPSQAMI